MDGGIKTKENDNTNKEDNGNHIKRLEIYWNLYCLINYINCFFLF